MGCPRGRHLLDARWAAPRHRPHCLQVQYLDMMLPLTIKAQGREAGPVHALNGNDAGNWRSQRDHSGSRSRPATASLCGWGSCRVARAPKGLLVVVPQWERIAPLTMRMCSACGQSLQEPTR
eukprot:12025400-Alexandrium_andersonii.AAC.1